MKNSIIMSILTFVLFFLISHFIPLTGDDWTNYNFHTNNIINIINIALEKYFNHEGRIMSRIFVIFFTNTKWLWEIFNALMMTGIYIGMTKIINSKHNKLVPLLLFISIICLERTMFMQSYLWVTGNCTYTIPLFLCIVYFFLVNKIWSNNLKQKKIIIGICCLINFVASMMVENISVALVFANILLLIYYYFKNKKVSKSIIAYTIISIFGLLVMLLSPGAHNRLMTENTLFSSYNIFEKCITNLPNFINFTFIANTILIVLLAIVLWFLIFKNYKSIKIRVLSTIYLIIPFITVGIKFLVVLSDKSSKARFLLQYTDWIIDPTNIITTIYWLSFIGLMFFAAIKFSDKYKGLFYLLVGIAGNLAMLMSPIWGGRTAIFTVFMLYIFAFILLNEVNIKKYVECITKYVLFGIIIVLTVTSLTLYYNVYRLQKDREYIINKQIVEGRETIQVYLFPEYALHNANAWNEFHQNSFKNYYGIDKEVELERIKTKWNWFIIYNNIKEGK